MTKRLCLLVALLLGFVASGRAAYKFDTIRFNVKPDTASNTPSTVYFLGPSLSSGSKMIIEWVAPDGTLRNRVERYGYTGPQSYTQQITDSGQIRIYHAHEDDIPAFDRYSFGFGSDVQVSNAVITSIEVNCISKKLRKLYVYGKQLTSLKLSGYMDFVSVSNTTLTSLDLSGCNVKELDCQNNNKLTSLDLSGCIVKELNCQNNNQLTSLNLSKNTALTNLNCQNNNQLTGLDLSKNTALTSLDCSNSQLTGLDLSKNTALTSLKCQNNNQLTGLDLSKNTALSILDCSNNQLTSLDLSKNTALTSLKCGNNQLTELNVEGYTQLRELDCDSNQLTSLDLSGCTSLTHIDCESNQITSLNLSGCTSLSSCTSQVGSYSSNYDGRYGNNPLTSLNVSGCTALTSLQCQDNQLTSLDASGCTALTSLYCDNNHLTALDVSGCTALTKLDCHYNHIPLSLLYDIYNLSSDWTYFYAYGQWDSISLRIEEPWDLSSERLIGSTVSDYNIYGNWVSSDDLYTEQEFLFQFHKPDYCRLVLGNETLPNLSFTWYVSVEPQDGYFVQVSSNWGGTVAITGSGIYQEGEEVTITALKYQGYRFVNWTKEDGSVFSTEAKYTFTVTENLRLTANFEIIPEEERLTISLSCNEDQGFVRLSSNNWYEDRYDEGTEITITAYPYSDYRFVNWTKEDGTVFSTEAEYTFTVTENLELTANFVEKETFTVNFSVNHPDWGYTYPDYVTSYQEGDEVTIYAYPYSDYRFVNWTKADGSVFSTEAEYTFVITENLDLTANFEKISDIPGDDVANENREEDNFAVYVQGRTIYLSEPRGRVQVFNVAGQCVYNGSSTVISVPNSGVYIVKVGTRSYKVVVR